MKELSIFCEGLDKGHTVKIWRPEVGYLNNDNEQSDTSTIGPLPKSHYVERMKNTPFVAVLCSKIDDPKFQNKTIYNFDDINNV